VLTCQQPAARYCGEGGDRTAFGGNPLVRISDRIEAMVMALTNVDLRVPPRKLSATDGRPLVKRRA
jgi:hypothetical protein